MEMFNQSLKPGGVNAHLGMMAHARQIEVIRQKDGVIVSEWPSVFPNPGKKIHHSAKWRRMVKALQEKPYRGFPPLYYVKKISKEHGISMQKALTLIRKGRAYAIATAKLGPSRLKNAINFKRKGRYFYIGIRRDTGERELLRTHYKKGMVKKVYYRIYGALIGPFSTAKIAWKKGGYNPNPFSSKNKRRAKIAKVAYQITYRLWKHFRHSGVPESVLNRVPQAARPYVEYGLKLNGIKIIKE